MRAGRPGDAPAIAALIAGFHRLITVHPDGSGAGQYVASVSEASERGYLESERYAYLVAEGCEEAVTLGVCSAEDEHLAKELMSLLGESVETSS